MQRSENGINVLCEKIYMKNHISDTFWKFYVKNVIILD